MKSSLISMFLLVFVFTATVTVAEAEGPVVESIEISPEEAVVLIDGTEQFTAVVRDDTATVIDTTVVWIVQGGIGTIDDGLFTGTTVGDGKVIAKLGAVGDTATVSVILAEEPVVESIEIHPNKQTVAIGDNIHFHAQVEDSEGEFVEVDVVWSVENEEVGSIDTQTGLFIAEAVGETNVIATVGELSDTAEVEVVEEIVREPGVNTVNIQRMHPDGKITRFGAIFAEGDTVTIAGIPHPLNFMNGTKLFFPEGSLTEDIILTFKIPAWAELKGKDVNFGDDIVIGITFEVTVGESVVSPYPFVPPLEVSMPYKRGLLTNLGLEPTDLGMYYIVGEGEFVEAGITGITVDEEENRITGIVSHFSDLVLAPQTVIPTIVEDSELPRGFLLSENFPNPFNPETTIAYTIPEASHVKLSIYNLVGQQIKTLVDEVKPVGTYSVVWDGTDESGAKVTSGLYFYRFHSGNFSQTRKLMLMK